MRTKQKVSAEAQGLGNEGLLSNRGGNKTALKVTSDLVGKRVIIVGQISQQRMGALKLLPEDVGHPLLVRRVNPTAGAVVVQARITDVELNESLLRRA